jgi:hypothetical protein
MRIGTRLLSSGVLWLALLVFPAQLSAQSGDTNKVHADYRNVLYTSTPPSVPPNGTPNLAAQLPEFNSVAFYSGSAGTNVSLPNTGVPNDGLVFLKRSVIATPFDGGPRIVVGRTFRFGEAITNIASLGIDDARQPVSIDPPTGARFVSGTNQTVGTEVGFVTITWYRTDGAMNSPVTYYIQDEPVREPVRIYHTKAAGEQFTGAPVVDLTNNLTVTPYYNTGITPSVLQLAGDRLNAQTGTGKIVLEYRNKTTSAFLGLEILDIRPFNPDFVTASDVGAWLTPNTNRSSITPLVSRGLTTNVAAKIPPYAYQFLRSGDTNDGRAFAVRPTSASDQIEAFWFRTNLAGVVWPYEMHRYTAVWPSDFGTLARRIYVTETAGPASVATKAPLVNINTTNAEAVFIHYNAEILMDDLTGVRTLYLEGNTSSWDLKARAVTGRILLHYERQGFVGVQFVDVVPYSEDFVDDWHIGDRLLPHTTYAETHALTPFVARGVNQDPNPNYAYQHNEIGTMNGFTFAVRKTPDDLQIELFWKRHGLAGVAWPYEMHRYRADWPPVSLTSKYQRYARGSTPGNLGPDVVIPAALSAVLMPFQEPSDHAQDVSANSFSTSGPGWSLLKYTPGNEVYFQVVRSVMHTNATEFSLALNPWNIGTEITDAYHQNPPANARPGYLHILETRVPKEDRYDWETYDGVPALPADAGNWTSAGDWNSTWTTKQIFAVNRGALEVWWSNVNSNGVQGVQWPSLVKRYDAVWPANPEEIVIASQLGSGGINEVTHKHFRVYYQNDAAHAGFNPNDEHAAPFEGNNGRAIFALRDDLDTPTTSEPYTLLKYQNPGDNDRWRFRVFKVMAEKAPFLFSYSSLVTPTNPPPQGQQRAMGLIAGQLIQPPFPVGYLNFLEYCTENQAVSGPYFRDRKTNYWARSAGDDGGAATIVMRYFYPTNTGLIPGLYFPPAKPPLPGRDVPSHVAWLDRRPGGTNGVPTDIAYRTIWTNVPSLRFGETLVRRKFGLPDIAGMKSVEIIYQQSLTNGTGESVKLVDATREYFAPLAQLPGGVLVSKSDGKTYFPELPPQLRMRLWYDGTHLRFKGQLVEPVAGEYYLLLNIITEREKVILTNLTSDVAFRAAINQLSANTLIEVPPNQTFDSLALTAGLARGGGYVTLVENNSTNLALNNWPDPVALHVIKVECPLYQGELKVISSDNPFDEKVTLRHSADLAGRADHYLFEWRTSPPHDGLPPGPPYGNWGRYSPQPSTGQGAIDITIGGPGLYTLSDNYFVCRYGTTNLVGGCTNNVIGGTNWSAWTQPMLAEGWIKRVLAGINPFDQRIKDFSQTRVNTLVSMISQAGPRSTGAVALNAAEANNYGLLEIYETVLNRGSSFSIGAGYNYGPANDALLLAATRIADLYTLLGNEAYADASDPTIAYGTDDGQYGQEASSIHCFQNQVDSLLKEELALLRGRDDVRLPSTTTSPFYNRLIWNFTQSDGEVAYANNYGMRDRNGTNGIDEADAKVEYPQGHGDAWGHYLTAVKGYYRLLRNPNFTWVPRIEAVLVGGVPVSVDYMDERKFAKAATLRAQTGAEIVNLTYRDRYVEDPAQQFAGYPDTRTNRYWGVSDWAMRAGQGALFDWVVGNALVPAAYQESYRISGDTMSQIGSHSAYLMSDEVITNVIPRLASEIPLATVDMLLGMPGRQFFSRGAFINSLDSSIGVTNRLRFQNAILSGSQTAGLTELIAAGLDLLKDRQFPTMQALEDTLRGVVGDAAVDAHFVTEIRPYVTIPTGLPVEGIQKIDRSTVTELRDLASAYVGIQEQMDKADLGLSPLGLVKNSIPFTIDPDLLEGAGRKTHFEQVYERSVEQVNNAVAVFNHAVNASQALRRQADQLADFQDTVTEREADFNNRLIEIFGYPYTDDIGPAGTYPSGYNGPDLYHYMYSDMTLLTGILPANVSVFEFTVTNRDLSIAADGGVTQAAPRLIKYHLDRNSFGFVKPPTWTGNRRAPGDIQKAHSQLLLAKSRFDRSLMEYDNLLSQTEDQTELLRSQYGLNAQEIYVLNTGRATQENLNDRIKRSRVRQLAFRWVGEKATLIARAISEGLPKTVGFIGGLATGFVMDPSFGGRAAAGWIAVAVSEVSRFAADRETIVELDHQQAKEEAQNQANITLTTLRQEQSILQQLAQIQQLVRQEPLLRLEIFTQQETLQQAEGDYASALARGQRVLEDRLRFRQQTAGHVQEYRYKDMAFRIFRNDAIQKYRAQFDTAAMYVYLAAKAYDYETNLKPEDPAHPGSEFLNQIVKTRTIGLVAGGVPQTGGGLTHGGDAGLADPMRRMRDNFSLLKGDLGINNPIAESLEFGLRNELFRVSGTTNPSLAWRQALESFRVRDLNQVPAVKQYCIFENSKAEPGLVIEFPTTVNKDLNHFVWPYGAGDRRFNDTAFATKIKSVGVSFRNYRLTGPGGLADTCYAYLLPVGADVMRSPRLYAGDTINYTREWKIVDQWLPVPHRLSDKNDSRLNDLSWIPIYSLQDGTAYQLGDLRGHEKFRVWHDSITDPTLTPISAPMRARRLISRSVWNTKWLLIIPSADLGGTTTAEYEESLNRFIYGGLVNGVRDGNGVTEIKLRVEAGSFRGR